MRLIARKRDLTPEEWTLYTTVKTAVKIYVSDLGIQPVYIFMAPNLFDMAEAIFNKLMTKTERKAYDGPVRILNLIAVYNMQMNTNHFYLYPKDTARFSRRQVMYFQHPLGQDDGVSSS